jgi:hypothetical protein
MGAVGPTQILVIVNGRVRVFDKDGNNAGVLDVSDSTFWDSVRAGLDITDPQVEYDRLSQRWVLSQINFDPSDPSMTNNRIMLAVSSGPEITSQSDFTFFSFRQNDPNPGSTARFADYPQMGVDKNAIYIGTNEFAASGSFTGTTAYVIRKSSVTGGGPMVVTAFRNLASGTGPGPFPAQPAQDMDPNVNEGYIVGVDNATFGRLDVRRITDPGGTPSISGNLTVNVPATTFPESVPAQGSPHKLDALDDRLFEAMIGRDPNGNPSLWTAHNIEVNSSGVASSSGGRDGDRWYQLGNLSTSPTLLQSGTLWDPATSNPRYFFIPSIAMNGQGHASLNSSTAGTGRFAEVASSAHLASDPPGTTEPFDITQTSSSTYNIGDTPERWGDYSQTVVDPTDNMTFWTFQEYTHATDDWGVRVIKLKAPPPATPSSATPNLIAPGFGSQQVEITGTSVNGSGFFDPGSGFPSHITATVSGGVTVNSVIYTDPTHVTLDLDTTGVTPATQGSQAVTITNPDGQSATGQNILVVGTDSTPPDPPIFTGTIPPSPANDNSPRVLGSAEPSSSVRLYTNAACTAGPVAVGSAAQLAGGLTVSVPDNSTTTFYGTATDLSSNVSSCSSTLPANGSVTYVEDSSSVAGLPDTTITKGPRKKTVKRRPKFRFSSSEPGATFRCQLDRGAFAPCTSPFVPPKLSFGKHVLRVTAVDSVGNVDPTPAVRKFKVLPS